MIVLNILVTILAIGPTFGNHFRPNELGCSDMNIGRFASMGRTYLDGSFSQDLFQHGMAHITSQTEQNLDVNTQAGYYHN